MPRRRKAGEDEGEQTGNGTKKLDGERSAAEKASKPSPLGRLPYLLVAGLVAFGLWFKFLRRSYPKVDYTKTILKPKILETHCQDHIGPPRVEKVTDGVWVAIGYDLANTILVETSEGHVVIDVAMNPIRSKTMREALEAEVGKAHVHTVIYTHSHVDHVGGAESWVDEGTKVWATDALMPHFFKQYAAFRKAESLRGSRQFGEDVPLTELSCSGLGRRADVKTAIKHLAFVVPTDTFSDFASFKVGGLTFELHEAHGETHDQLLVWIPEKRVLMPGDNYYEAFPNLYTIRGSSPRPIKAWIASLDLMRRLAPDYLVPSHTRPVVGRDVVARQLRDYRDGIQSILTQTVRGANNGKTMDELAETVGLPPHLRNQTALDELYGQIDWSVRAIFTNELGWFDGRAEDLYRLPHGVEARKTLESMGGIDKVVAMVKEAQSKEDDRWALHLLRIISDAGVVGDAVTELEFQEMYIRSLRGVSEHVYNTNGRAYLLQVAKEVSGEAVMEDPVIREVFVRSMPIALLFDVMTTRVIPEFAADMHRTALFNISGKKYYVTIRYGVVEIVQDEPLYGTPDPIVEFKVDEMVFRQIALKVKSPIIAVAQGEATITGDLLGFKEMMDCFETGA